MSGSSTPVETNEGNANSSTDINDDTIIEQPSPATDEIISRLMERVKTLEVNQQRTMQQLLESEVKRAHLQRELSAKGNGTRTPPPVDNVAHASQQPTRVNITQNNDAIAAVNQSISLHTATDTVYSQACQSQLHQQTSSAPTMTSIEGTSARPSYQIENHYSHVPPRNTTTNIGSEQISPTTAASTLYLPYAPQVQTGTYTNVGLSYATNMTPSQPIITPTYQGMYTPMGSNVQVAPRKLYDLPEFSGQPEQWPVFITAFRESTSAYGYTQLENTFRLQKCLKGVAREEIECLLIDPRNILQIIEQLEFKYGRPELLIGSQLQKIREITCIQENHLERFLPFATKVQNLTTFLKSANATQHLSNPTLIEELVSKMPMTKRIEWVTYSSGINPYPTLAHFNTWVNQVARIIAKVIPAMTTTPHKGMQYQSGQLSYATTRGYSAQTRANTKPVLAMNETNDEYTVKRKYCVKCSESHFLSECEQFLEMPVYERWGFVKTNRLCFACLRKGHNVIQCKGKKGCHVGDCNKWHNAVFHEESNDNENKVNMIRQKSFLPKTTKLLYKLVPIEMRGPNNKIVKTYAFLDEGSSTSLIHESLARQMGFNSKTDLLTLSWIEGPPKNVKSMFIQLNIKAAGNSKRWCNMRAHSVPDLELPSQTVNLEELHDKFHHLKNLPFAGYTDAVPKVLIGLDNCHLTPNVETVKLDKYFIATNTPLGWAIYGNPYGTTVNKSGRIAVISQNTEQDRKVDELVAEYFTTENFGVALTPTIESKEVVRARQIMKKTTTKKQGRYKTGLIWKNDNTKLPDSYNMALNRLYTIERKMSSDAKFGSAYEKAMESYISKGYAIKLLPSEVVITPPHTWYLPHFAVFNVNKPGKLRLVFDAAASVNGTSLNSELIKGPDENQPLLKILFQFREGIIGVCADIREMFLQVRIRESDRDAQRFLWRRNQGDAVEVYTMAAMIFGATCSPCSAQYIKNLNAIANASDQPEVVDAIVNNHYVDDMVCSFQNEEDALRISLAIKATHAKAGFEIRGFISNAPYVQAQLNKDDETQSPNVNMNTSDAVEKVLGMVWKSNTDEFIFKLQLNRVNPKIIDGAKCPTKRELLCLVMSVYDPFGMLADLLIYGKILLQEVWRTGVDWDDAIPEDIYHRFTQWVQCLQLAKEFHIPRCYDARLFDPESVVELHIFNDASQTAFASVAYWRIITSSGIHVCFIAGKTKCAPFKILSVPRLELQAAVLGTRLKHVILESHRMKPSRITLWSDSKTVISWIKSDHRQYKSFVAHRVGEVLDSTHENDWRWVPSNSNTADPATRTIYPLTYNPESMWIQGPEFLLESEEDWPQAESVCSEDCAEERKQVYINVITTNTLIDFKRFSSYLRLQRSVGWMLRFYDTCRKKTVDCITPELTSTELQRAEIILCKLVQREIYNEEINALKTEANVSRNSTIFSLTPCLNSDGLLCVSGRIDYALALPESARNPIILPNRHALTDLIVMWYHQKLFHQNDGLVINELRRKFWIINLRGAVKRAKSNCQFCKNNRAKPVPPLMGQLPIDRLQPYVRPFTYTGLDYFGPMFVTIGRRREKRWAALFTCLTIRAVHIELAADLSTDACIICIRNFINRRGVPAKIRSDMGTNFVGTDSEFKRVDDLFDHNYIQSELAIKNIVWEFNCPANPSSGGCWERLIQSIKKVLAITLKDVVPKVETLHSLLIEAENIVNSRPLTHLPVTPENPDPLTPNHFLLGTTNSTQTPGDVTPICSRKQYRISQQLKNHFWRRWVREYLPTLTRRTKWFTNQTPIEVNDLVLICDEDLPRSQWRRGIVTFKFTAKDGQTRIVEVRTANGTLRRPVSKLAVLDVLGEVPHGLHGGWNVVDRQQQ